MGALDGIRVLDLSQLTAGPCCTQLLADAGAEVVKIEPPVTGEAIRRTGPVIDGRTGDRARLYFVRYGRNKRSVTLDITRPEGREVLLELTGTADVLVENFKPGRLDGLGLGYPDVARASPRLVYASISGFGHDAVRPSPFSRRPLFDVVAQAMGGLMAVTGSRDGEPAFTGASVGDVVPAVLAALGICQALLARARTGRGQHVDVAMYDSMAFLNDKAILLALLTGERSRRGVPSPGIAPYDVYPAKDGHVVVGVVSDDQWRRLCEAMGRADLAADPRLSTGLGRFREDAALVRPAVAAFTRARTRAEVVAACEAAQVPAGAVQAPEELGDCPQLAARGMLPTVVDAELGPLRLVGNPIKLSAEPDLPPRPAPRVGEHTDAVLAEAGFAPARVAALRAAGVV